MVTLHLLQSASLHSLALNKLTKHTHTHTDLKQITAHLICVGATASLNFFTQLVFLGHVLTHHYWRRYAGHQRCLAEQLSRFQVGFCLVFLNLEHQGIVLIKHYVNRCANRTEQSPVSIFPQPISCNAGHPDDRPAALDFS